MPFTKEILGEDFLHRLMGMDFGEVCFRMIALLKMKNLTEHQFNIDLPDYEIILSAKKKVKSTDQNEN